MELSRLLNRGIKFITDRDYRFCILAGKGLYHNLPDEIYLKRMFKANLGYELNLENPITFNEKLQWLKIHDRRPEYTMMVDKYEVKKYIAKKIGEEYIIPTLGIWDNFDDIDFSSLPNQFVLKCTHDSGGLVICRDKGSFDKEKARKKINACLKRNFYYYGREWPYKDVKPRIIAEKYMEDSGINELRDYKFFCFGGIAKCYKIDFDRFIEHRANYFDTNNNLLSFGEMSFPPDPEKDIYIPKNIQEMKKLSEELSKGVPFLRADFYDVEGKTYFGELTLFPASGFGKLTNDGDSILGKWMELPGNRGGYCIVTNEIICVISKNGRTNSELTDYKVHCFNGAPKVILVCRERFSELGLAEDFFDTGWKHLDIKRDEYRQSSSAIEKPVGLQEMLDLASELSKNIPFIRTDFYEINGKTLFGEVTLFPASGFHSFIPNSTDKMFGDWMVLPTNEGGGNTIQG